MCAETATEPSHADILRSDFVHLSMVSVLRKFREGPGKKGLKSKKYMCIYNLQYRCFQAVLFFP